MQISDVVDVNVSIAAAFIATQDFGTGLVAAYHNKYSDRVRTYEASSWSVAMLAEGFLSTDPAYKALDAAFKQDPRPSRVKLGRLSAPETQIVRITPVVKNGLYRHGLNFENAAGAVQPVAYTEDGTPNLSEICTGLASAFGTLGAPITANGSSGTYVDVQANNANEYFSYRDLTDSLTLRDLTSAPAGIAADMAAIQAADDEWYGLGIASPAPATIEAFADWIESNQPHVFSASTHDMGVITGATDDIATSIMNQSYQGTLVSYHSKALQHFGLGWMASMLTYEPGQVDWSAKTVVGAEPDKLTPTQEGHATNKRASTYGTLAKAPWTGNAQTGSGYFIDLVQTKHWLKARLAEFLIAKRKALPKVPYTDPGVGALVLEAMMEVVALGQVNGALDTDPTTVVYVVPKVAQQTQADKVARRFRGSRLSVRSTGGVHKIDIDVNLAV